MQEILSLIGLQEYAGFVQLLLHVLLILVLVRQGLGSDSGNLARRLRAEINNRPLLYPQ